jgi:hypothetical protein
VESEGMIKEVGEWKVMGEEKVDHEGKISVVN